jgi:hypothetical protein
MTSAGVRGSDKVARTHRATDGSRLRRVHAAGRVAAAPASMVSRQRRVWRLEVGPRLQRRGVQISLRVGVRAGAAGTSPLGRMPGPGRYWHRVARLLPGLARYVRIRVPRPVLVPGRPGRHDGGGCGSSLGKVRRPVRRWNARLEDSHGRGVGPFSPPPRHALSHRTRGNAAPSRVGAAHRHRLHRLMSSVVVVAEAGRIRRGGKRVCAPGGDAVVTP